ncbi:MAG: hypothetical protein ABSG39_08520 [Acidimicrobiales bacterium]
MKRTKARRLLSAACGPALGVLLAVPVGGLLAGAAGADGCYTGCTSPATGITTSSGSKPTTPSSAGVTTSPSGLAFTGADIEEMALIGVAAIGVGAVLVRSRRRTA